jgi:hypothetical protein
MSETIDDKCATLETSSNCSLSDEIIDGVQTFTNGSPTGTNPLPTCQLLSSPGGTVTACRPWWSQSRTYLCHNTNAWSFDDMRARYNTVVNSVTANGSYSDQTKGKNGVWTAGSGSVVVPTPPAVAPCELSCKTQSTVGSTQVLVSGTIQLRSNPAAGGNYTYKLCVNNACPLDTGEVIIDDCQCLSDFNQAAMAIQSVRMGTKDMICTTGVAKPLQ